MVKQAHQEVMWFLVPTGYGVYFMGHLNTWHAQHALTFPL